jgi:hypothetical protein
VSLKVRPYSDIDADLWDEFNEKSLQGTLLHNRSFLSYHGERFVDQSLIVYDEDKCVGLFPAAFSVSDFTEVVSHPGATYGGIVHCGGLCGERMVEALSVIQLHYRKQGLKKLTYKTVPTFYHKAPSQDDLYALYRIGAKRVRCDLSTTIDLCNRLTPSQRRRRSLKKAVKANIEIVKGSHYIEFLWGILNKNLEKKHSVNPVHKLDEILLLSKLFPLNISCVCAQLNGDVIAGVLFFITETTYHAQYIASNEKGHKLSALDAIFDNSISFAGAENKRWFDFGISTERQGNFLNNGLYNFKTEFGGGGFVHEFYEVDLMKN